MSSFNMADFVDGEHVIAKVPLNLKVFYKMLEMDERPKAVDLLKRIQRRQFYKTVMELRLKNDNPVLQMSNTEVLDQVFGFISTQDSTLKKNDIAVLRRSITMGMGSRNPIEEVWTTLEIQGADKLLNSGKLYAIMFP